VRTKGTADTEVKEKTQAQQGTYSNLFTSTRMSKRLSDAVTIGTNDLYTEMQSEITPR